MMESKANEAILRIQCVDQPGIIASVTQYLKDHGGNILDLDQHTDSENSQFYMRVSWDLNYFKLEEEAFKESFSHVIASTYEMRWDLNYSKTKHRIAIFVSQHLHCLYDMLGRWKTKEWDVEIPLIISNHASTKEAADQFGIPFFHFPIHSDNKKEQEEKELELLSEYNIDTIVLARYMQILSGEFINHFKHRIINIHHSFLPAFAGARPYHSAYKRGVKIIGATSHYVTEELDAGPIIEQDIVTITHRDDVKELVRKGRDLETLVLSRAVWKHIQHKTMVTGNRTIIFN